MNKCMHMYRLAESYGRFLYHLNLYVCIAVLLKDHLMHPPIGDLVKFRTNDPIWCSCLVKIRE